MKIADNWIVQVRRGRGNEGDKIEDMQNIVDANEKLVKELKNRTNTISE